LENTEEVPVTFAEISPGLNATTPAAKKEEIKEPEQPPEIKITRDKNNPFKSSAQRLSEKTTPSSLYNLKKQTNFFSFLIHDLLLKVAELIFSSLKISLITSKSS